LNTIFNNTCHGISVLYSGGQFDCGRKGEYMYPEETTDPDKLYHIKLEKIGENYPLKCNYAYYLENTITSKIFNIVTCMLDGYIENWND
jgi:hypothetical protein